MTTETTEPVGQRTLTPDLTRPYASDGAPPSPADVTAGQEATEPSFWLFVREMVETIVLSLIIFLVIRQGIQNYRIESHSMEPNFQEGQFVLVNKLAYKLGAPQRGDVVVFHNPDNPREDYIKRVIGLPGDTVEFRDGQVLVNGEVLDEPYIKVATYGAFGDERIVVEEDHLFVMGDNRPNSRDSRRFGELSMNLVVGKAWVRVWPISTWGVVSHYDLIPGQATELDY